MERMAHESTCGSFPVVGDRRDRGALEHVKGRITWRTHFGVAEDGNCQVFVTMIPDGERRNAFVPSVINLEREFIGRLGKYDQKAQRELVSMLDWAETKGFDVRVADDPAVHATFGSFSFEGVRRDRGGAESVGGRISWAAFPEKAPTAMRCVRVSMASNFSETCLDDNMPCGEIDAECGFVGSLAEGDGEALDCLISRMGWNANAGEFNVWQR